MRAAKKARSRTGRPTIHATKRPSVGSQPGRMPLWANAPLVKFSLKVNTPSDKYEQEADRVAGHVMRMPEPAVQRKSCACGKPAGPAGMCEDCKQEQLNVQRKVSGGGAPPAAPPIIHQVLQQPGRPLDGATRSFMEARFDQNFGDVRVHTGKQATESAQAVNALAYTVGHNVVFARGQYKPQTESGKGLLAHELAHTLQQSQWSQHVQRAPDDGTKSGQTTRDPLCDKYNFHTVLALVIQLATAYQVDKSNTQNRLSLIRTLKLVHRCAASLDEIELILEQVDSILGPEETRILWQEAGTAFGGYTGMYPGFAGDIQKRLENLGTSETLKFSSFKLSETGSGSEHRRKAKSIAASEVGDLGRTDIIYFRGHQFAQYRAPGLFSNGSETYGFDLRYIEQAGGFANVKLMISTSCATLCKEALEVFTKLFPNAVILGYRKSAPLDGKAVRDSLQTKVQSLNRPLLLEESVDIDAIISAWKSVIEERHAGDTAQLPGYFRGGKVYYWDGKAWQDMGAAEEANKCRQKGDFRSQYPNP